jgi:hypothetical protein
MLKHWTVQKGEWYSRELDTAESIYKNSRYIGTSVSRVQRTVQMGKRHSREQDTTEKVQEYIADSTEVRRVQHEGQYSGQNSTNKDTVGRNVQRTAQQGQKHGREEDSGQ